MAARVVLFLDYQNVYMGARETFPPQDSPKRFGQVDPIRLGELIVRKRATAGELVQVRVYRGLPDRMREPRTYAAVLRQSTVWGHSPKVEVFTRRLRYPTNWPLSPPKEKGIDVALAIDFVVMAVRGEYGVGIIMSTDTDLVPALEAVTALGGRPFPRCEVAAWSAPNSHSQRLGVPGRRIWCHWLDENEYRVVADPRDYSKP